MENKFKYPKIKHFHPISKSEILRILKTKVNDVENITENMKPGFKATDLVANKVAYQKVDILSDL